MAKVTRDWLLPLYRQMQLIRRFEEEAARSYVQGKIGGFLHLYIGQEAVAVGANAALRPDDYVRLVTAIIGLCVWLVLLNVVAHFARGLAFVPGTTPRAGDPGPPSSGPPAPPR